MTEGAPRLDLLFPVAGNTIPRDHGYALYAALSRLLDAPDRPVVHESTDLAIFPIRGTSAGNGSLLLTDRSTLRLRVPAEKIPRLLPLAGKPLDLDGCRIRIGVPHVAALVPAPALSSPLVLIKLAHTDGNGVTPDAFLASARRKLDEMNIRGEPTIPLIRTGPRAGEPRRRVIKVKDQIHVGYALIVQGLAADESLRLQEQGLGGRRLMGCGLFLPHDEKREAP